MPDRSAQVFRITVSFTATEAVLGVSGDLDFITAPGLAAVLDAMIDRGYCAVVIDLGELDFIDGRGLRVVADGARRLQAVGNILRLRSPSPIVTRLLDINGLGALVLIEPDGARRAELGREQAHDVADSPLAGVVADIVSRRGGAVLPTEAHIVDGTLRLVVNLAKATVGGADGVSVSLLRDGRMTTVAASDRTVSEMDAGQYETREGPCLAASMEGRWFHVASLADEKRWPAFIPVAMALGIHAILSNPLRLGRQPVGALNIYSRAPGAFGRAEQELAAMIASEASAVLSETSLSMSTQRLQEALRNREVVALAQGVLMERTGIAEHGAFDELRRFSQRSDRPLRERAEDVVASTRRWHPEAGELAGVPEELSGEPRG